MTKHQGLRAHAAVGFSTQWFHYELSHFHALAEFTERALEDEKAALQTWLDARDAGLDTRDTDGHFLYLDDASELRHTFPTLVRGALVVAIVSLFEAFLARQSRAAGVWCGCSAEALRGLNQQLEFLGTHAAVLLPKQSAYWQGMKTIEKVRHLLVHSEGRLPKDRDNAGLRALLERDGFLIDEHDQILFTRSAIEWVAETLGTLANEIDVAIRRAIGTPM